MDLKKYLRIKFNGGSIILKVGEWGKNFDRNRA